MADLVPIDRTALHDWVRRNHLVRERATYPYLPDVEWMRQGGYAELMVGHYEWQSGSHPPHCLTMLS